MGQAEGAQGANEEGANEEEAEVDELPTLPPTPVEWSTGLRWATREPPPLPPRARATLSSGPPAPDATAQVPRQAPPTLPLPALAGPAGPAGARSQAASSQGKRPRRAGVWALAALVVLIVVGGAVFAGFAWLTGAH